MQFNRDEFLLLSRQGRVPSTHRSRPLPDPGPSRPKRRRTGFGQRLRSLAGAVLAVATVGRPETRGLPRFRRDR